MTVRRVVRRALEAVDEELRAGDITNRDVIAFLSGLKRRAKRSRSVVIKPNSDPISLCLVAVDRKGEIRYHVPGNNNPLSHSVLLRDLRHGREEIPEDVMMILVSIIQSRSFGRGSYSIQREVAEN